MLRDIFYAIADGSLALDRTLLRQIEPGLLFDASGWHNAVIRRIKDTGSAVIVGPEAIAVCVFCRYWLPAVVNGG